MSLVSMLIAIASPTHEASYMYFSDATKQTSVGEFVLFCSGNSVLEGVQTQYATKIYETKCKGTNSQNWI